LISVSCVTLEIEVAVEFIADGVLGVVRDENFVGERVQARPVTAVGVRECADHLVGATVAPVVEEGGYDRARVVMEKLGDRGDLVQRLVLADVDAIEAVRVVDRPFLGVRLRRWRPDGVVIGYGDRLSADRLFPRADPAGCLRSGRSLWPGPPCSWRPLGAGLKGLSSTVNGAFR
jgi:hypothetical protein